MANIDTISYGGTNYGIGGSGTGLTTEVKEAILACFEKVAWIDDNGQDCYDALEAALYPPANLVSISCVYTQSGTVYTTDTLDSLKSDLVVTAHYDNSSTETITAYTLSGTLTVGTSTITVSYGGKTTTFYVTVTQADNSLYNWDFTQSLTDSKQGAVASCGSGVTRSSNGLTFDGTSNGWVYLANMDDYLQTAFTVEVDITTAKTNTSQVRSFLCTLDGGGETMSYSTLPDGVCYSSGWKARLNGTDNSIANASSLGFFDGTTMKIQCDQVNSTFWVYKDNILIDTINSKPNKGRLGLSSGRTDTVRAIGAGTIVTAVRVYEGIV